MFKKCFGFDNIGYAIDGLENHKYYYDNTINNGKRKYNQLLETIKEWGELGKDGRPTAYDILARLTTYEPSQDVDEFAKEYGYMKPSQALKVHKAVLNEWANVQRLFNQREVEMLQEIN